MKIHFICRGNTYRGRIAEAYLNSKLIKDIEVSSSGIEAEGNLDGPICEYTKEILKKHKIFQFAKESWTQTSKTELEKQDLIILMSKHHFDYCKNKLNFCPKRYEIWNIKDVSGTLSKVEMHDLRKVTECVENNYSEITQKVDDLINRLQGEKHALHGIS
jgi:protein-tyrosine-phosphatase